MTLQELRNNLAIRLGLDTVAADGLVSLADAQLLNQAARFIGNEIQIPRKSIILAKNDLINGITLPPDFVDVIRASAPDQEVVPILPAESYLATNMPYRTMESARFGGHFVYDPEGAVRLRYVVGPENDYPEEVKLVYMASWNNMTNATDAPWLNQYARFHEVIAARAAMSALLLLDPGERETQLRFAHNQAEYQNMFENLREFVETPTHVTGPAIGQLVRRRYTWR